MSFLITDDEFWEKYIEIWEKVKNSIKKNLIVNMYSDERKNFDEENSNEEDYV